jgi:phage terminase Nu1 subunit (DNA packaging protein)
LEFIRAWDAATPVRGGRTRLLREHNLDKATVRRWLLARDRGELEESMTKAAKAGRKSQASIDRAELARLRVENEQLRQKVARSEAVQEILGKAYELLEGINESSEPDPKIPLALMSADEYAEWLKRHNLS